MSIGLVTALPAELRCLTHLPITLNKPFRIADNLVAIVSGIGATNARRAAELLQFEPVDAMISWGTAAGLTSGTASGDLILPDSVYAIDGNELKVDRLWRDSLADNLSSCRLSVHTAALAESRLLLETPAQKSALHSETGAIAADMESAAVIKVANANKIPCIIIRAIVDSANQTLPFEITRHTDRYGSPNISGILYEIVRQPALLPVLISLSSAMGKATRTLRTVARQAKIQILQTA